LSGADSDPATNDRRFMQIALRLARRGLGTTAPNPSVGAVIVDEASGEVIARGWTQPGGRPHAETEALRRAGARARGATMYVTLEPCSHYGKTPPCAQAIIAAGIGRVVVGILDPDPRVAGRGVAMLRAAGIGTDRGICAEEADWITRGHISRVTERRPFIQLKMALGRDGTVPRGSGGQPTWVTGPLARAHAHLLRAQADAILVGAGTVRDDDPELTCRLPGMRDRSPIRIVLCGRQLPSLASKLVRTAGAHAVWLFCGSDVDVGRQSELAAASCRLFHVTMVAGRPWLPAVGEALVAEGITRLLVEGGPTVWRSFFAVGAVDEVVQYRAGAEAPAIAPGETVDAGDLMSFAAPMRFAPAGRERLGGDDLLILHRARGH
jgi:diaminohydroxyphosphoribosylaminopyrimidine deaminase/5-amino-6-(5-phosphoribosylamino)uracil reductase